MEDYTIAYKKLGKYNYISNNVNVRISGDVANSLLPKQRYGNNA